MVRIGNILIDPNSVDTILRENKGPLPDKERGFNHIQIIYKSGVVKNLRSDEIGMSYNDFINEFEKVTKQAEDARILRLMAAIQQNNG